MKMRLQAASHHLHLAWRALRYGPPVRKTKSRETERESVHEMTQAEIAEILAETVENFQKLQFERLKKEWTPLNVVQKENLVSACNESLATGTPLIDVLQRNFSRRASTKQTSEYRRIAASGGEA